MEPSSRILFHFISFFSEPYEIEDLIIGKIVLEDQLLVLEFKQLGSVELSLCWIPSIMQQTNPFHWLMHKKGNTSQALIFLGSQPRSTILYRLDVK